GAGEAHLPLPVHPLADRLEGALVLPDRHQEADDAQLAEVEGEGAVTLRVDLRVDPFGAQVLADELPLELVGRAVDLGPSLDDLDRGVVQAPDGAPIAPPALLADGPPADDAAPHRRAVRVDVAGDLPTERAAGRAGIRPAVLLPADGAAVHLGGLVGGRGGTVGTIPQVVGVYGIAGRAARHSDPGRGVRLG